VPKLIAVKNIVLSPATYGIEIETIPNTPYFTTVQAPAKIDMKVAAQLAGMSEDDFRALNPAHNKPVAMASTGTLVVPLDRAETFRANLEAYDQPLVSWTTYQAKRGEALDSIARSHGITTAQLRAANDSAKVDKKGRLRAAGPVMVPMKAVVKGAAPATPARVASLSVPTASVGAPARATAAATPKTYLVRAGDTLYAIARRFDFDLDDLLEANGFTPKSVIRPGQKLRLP
jgi:membrane-bound lytic murein transglycosylase D